MTLAEQEHPFAEFIKILGKGKKRFPPFNPGRSLSGHENDFG
jgi:hypothetical protein